MAKNCHDSSFFHFRANLTLVRQLRDRAAEGRAFGNLGNTHYLLGNFDKAVQYHEEVWIPNEKSIYVLSCSVSFLRMAKQAGFIQIIPYPMQIGIEAFRAVYP